MLEDRSSSWLRLRLLLGHQDDAKCDYLDNSTGAPELPHKYLRFLSGCPAYFKMASFQSHLSFFPFGLNWKGQATVRKRVIFPFYLLKLKHFYLLRRWTSCLSMFAKEKGDYYQGLPFVRRDINFNDCESAARSEKLHSHLDWTQLESEYLNRESYILHLMRNGLHFCAAFSTFTAPRSALQRSLIPVGCKSLQGPLAGIWSSVFQPKDTPGFEPPTFQLSFRFWQIPTWLYCFLDITFSQTRCSPNRPDNLTIASISRY